MTTQHAQYVHPRHETRPRADQVARDVREGRVLTIRQEQLAERAHKQEQNSADDHVDQQDRRTRDRDRLARTHEQARPDCTADRNQLNMAILQVSLELFAALLTGLVVHNWLAAHSFSFPPDAARGRRFARSLRARGAHLTLQRYRNGPPATEFRCRTARPEHFEAAAAHETTMQVRLGS